MNDPIITDLIQKLAERLVHNTRCYLRDCDETENAETGGNRDSANDNEYVYHMATTDIEDSFQDDLCNAVAELLGIVDEDESDEPSIVTPTMLGRGMLCHQCETTTKCVKVNLPKPNAVDPTETYTLECGHTVI